MNEILTAKEWLEKEGIYTSIAKGIDIVIILERGIINSELMEKYADYKTKMLEGKILQFRQMLEKQAINHATKLYKDWFKTDQVENNIVLESYISCVKEDMLLKDYDKHFNITTEKQGKIN